MKTDDLIRTLAADLAVHQKTVGQAAIHVVPIGLAASTGLFLLALGARPDLLTQAAVIAPKLLATGALTLSAMALAMRMTRPERATWEFALLALPLCVIAGLVSLDLAHNGLAGWRARATGMNGLYCLSMIPLLSLAPLAAILAAAHRGAVTRHFLAGAIAGMAAAGLGASLYALHCTDDSPLFVALWYSLATAVMAVVGAIACRLAVRW